MDLEDFNTACKLPQWSSPSEPRKYEFRNFLASIMIRLQRIYNFLLFHAILYSVLDIIGIYYTLLYYFWD